MFLLLAAGFGYNLVTILVVTAQSVQPQAPACGGNQRPALTHAARPFVEPGGLRNFNDDLRFAEQKLGWNGLDGQIYMPH
jgi:hypothetical protein